MTPLAPPVKQSELRRLPGGQTARKEEQRDTHLGDLDLGGREALTRLSLGSGRRSASKVVRDEQLGVKLADRLQSEDRVRLWG